METDVFSPLQTSREKHPNTLITITRSTHIPPLLVDRFSSLLSRTTSSSPSCFLTDSLLHITHSLRCPGFVTRCPHITSHFVVLFLLPEGPDSRYLY